MKKTYVVGDLHGCYDEFIELSNQIGITDNDLIISLGDVVDRGNKSLELYNYFKNRENTIVLMGNHERKHLRGVLSYSQEIVKVQFAEEYKGFKEWLKTLPYYNETNEAIIVHAFFEHDKTLSEQKEEVLSGTTSGRRYLEAKYEDGKYWQDYYKGMKPIIYGHHVVGDTPKIKNNTYGIDTGACHGGYLTVIELPGFITHQVKVKTDYWKEAQSKWQIPVLKAKNWESMKIEHIRNEIKKLSYKNEVEVKNFLKEIENWLDQLLKTIEVLKDRLEDITLELKEKYKDEFGRNISKLSYSSFLYKANSKNLKISDLEKTLYTPRKIINLAIALNLEDIPNRGSL